MPWTIPLLGRARLFALAAAALAAFVALWHASPGALILDIPMARHTGGVPFWTDRHSTRLGYYDEWGVAHVRRQAGSSEPAAHGWRTAAEAFVYFERWLTDRGWRLSGSVVLDPALPESWFLPPESMRSYYRPRSHDRVLLAIWPRGSDGWLRVVLVTARPTLIERIRLYGQRKKESEEEDE